MRTATIALGVLAMTGCNLQYHMLYYPSPYLPSAAEMAANQIDFWPAAPADYRGFIGTTEIGKVKGTVVVFHGNAGTAADRAYYIKPLGSLGYRVILAEYPGYGRRSGHLGEKSFVSDAQATIRLAAETYAEPLFLLGESLGCGVAAGVASDASLRIDGIVLITPWDTLTAVAKSLFPWLPVGLLMKDKYDSIAYLKSFTGPVSVIGAEHDEILPIKHARALYESLGTRKRMWTLKGAGHNNWPMAVDIPKWREFMDFVGEGKGMAP